MTSVFETGDKFSRVDSDHRTAGILRDLSNKLLQRARSGGHRHQRHAACQVQLHLGSDTNEVIVHQNVAVDAGKVLLNRTSCVVLPLNLAAARGGSVPSLRRWSGSILARI